MSFESCAWFVPNKVRFYFLQTLYMLHVKLMPPVSRISSTKYYDVITPTNIFKQKGNVFDFTSHHQSSPFSGNRKMQNS